MDARFKADRARGHEGEVFLAQREGLQFASADEHRWDLEYRTISASRCTVEVKTDSYDQSLTPNFFMELRTRIAGKPGEYVGGPWRAASHGVDHFVYLYHHPERTPSVGYWFDDVPALVAHLDAHRADYGTRRVRHGRVMAVGLLVPRRTLEAITRRVVYE